MIEIVSDERGKIEVGHSGLFGQMIRGTRADGEVRTTLLIECREEYDYEMIETMRWLGLISDTPPDAGADAPGTEDERE